MAGAPRANTWQDRQKFTYSQCVAAIFLTATSSRGCMPFQGRPPQRRRLRRAIQDSLRLSRLRDLRSSRRWGPLLSRRRPRARRQHRETLLQLIEQSAGLATILARLRRLRRSRGCLLARWRAGIDDRGGMALKTCPPRQDQAGDKEACRQKRRGPRQNVGGAAAAQEAAGRTDEAAAFRFLQQHHANQRDYEHQMNNDQDSQHSEYSSTPRGLSLEPRRRRRAEPVFHIGNVRGLYTVGGGFSMAVSAHLLVAS